MKKLITKVISAVAMVSTMALLLSGCFLGGGTPVLGKEGAMLLLANERMNGEMLDKNDSIFRDAEEALVGMAEQGRSFLSAYKNEEKEESFTARMAASSNLVTDIAAPGRSYTQFNETVLQSVFLAERGADNIRLMKEKVRVLDTWVSFSKTKMLLHVEENSELLLTQDEYYDSICYRTRLEDGTERYDLIQFYRDEDYAIRASYIKNQLYDCNMINRISTGEYEYIGFVAEKVEERWECLEYRYFPENEIPYDYSYVIMTEDLCFKAYKAMHYYGAVDGITLSSDDRTVDIIRMTGDETIGIYNIFIGTFEGYQGVLVGGANEFDNNLVLGDGTILQNKNNRPEGEVNIDFLVKYDTAWGVEFEMSFSIVDPDPEVRNATFAKFLKEIGISYNGATTEELIAKMNQAKDLINQIDRNFEWNGYPIGTHEGSAAAHAVEYEIIDHYISVRESYKNYPVVKESEIRGLGLASFAEMENASATIKVGANSVTVTSASASVTDLTLFTAGEKYHLAFALTDGSGLIHLDGYDKNEVVLSGDSLSLSINNVTLNLEGIAQGQYQLVMYASTSDGIRSTKATVIGNVTVTE